MSLLDTLSPKSKADRALNDAASLAAFDAFDAMTSGRPLSAALLSAGLNAMGDPFNPDTTRARRSAVSASILNDPSYAGKRRTGELDDEANYLLCRSVAEDPEFLSTCGRGTLARHAFTPGALPGLLGSVGLDPSVADLFPAAAKGAGAKGRRARAEAVEGADAVWRSIPLEARTRLVETALAHAAVADSLSDMSDRLIGQADAWRGKLDAEAPRGLDRYYSEWEV